MAEARIRHESGKVEIDLCGDWSLQEAHPTWDTLSVQLANGDTPIKAIHVSGKQLGDWDSSLVNIFIQIRRFCERKNIAFEATAIPNGVCQLAHLSFSASEYKEQEPEPQAPSWLTMAGNHAFPLLGYLGEVVIDTWNTVCRRSAFRSQDLWFHMAQTGAASLFIVALINFLVGLIIAFVGSIQLSQLGANIYVANLVGIATTRELGAVMTAIILSGRVGAAFAAAVGSMEVSEEIDALRVTGVSPVAFLVLPRLFALSFMMLPLCVFADFFGILGGGLISTSFFDVSWIEYINQTKIAVKPSYFFIGLAKSVVFGILISLWGCYHGLRCKRNSSAVGDAATSAVVYAITSIIVADAVFAVGLNLFKI